MAAGSSPTQRLARLALLALALGTLLAPTTAPGGPAAAQGGELTLQSSAFEAGGTIPSLYTCEGPDTSPALRWQGAPEATQAYALIVEDPDVPDPAAPTRTWVHWVLYDLPSDTLSLPADVAFEQLPAGTRQGKNDWRQAGYRGPCPPRGKHRYFFKLYALKKKLPDLNLPTSQELERAMEGLILAKAELVGTYEKKQP